MTLYVAPTGPNVAVCSGCLKEEPIPAGPISVQEFQAILGGLIAKHRGCEGERYVLTDLSRAYASAWEGVRNAAR